MNNLIILKLHVSVTKGNAGRNGEMKNKWQCIDEMRPRTWN